MNRYRFKRAWRRCEPALFLITLLFAFAWIAQWLGAPLNDYEMRKESLTGRPR